MENLKATFLRLTNSDPNKPLTSSQITLLEEKLLLAFPVLHTPTHPTYTVMIENAINKLDEVNGSSEESISKYIKANYDGLPWAHATYLRHHLNKLCEDGEIVLNSISTSKCYTTSARAVVEDCNSRGKQRTRVFVTFRRERKECGVDEDREGEKDVVEVSETSMMSGKSEAKRRKRCLGLEDDDEVRGDANVGGEQSEQNGDCFIKEGNEHDIGTVPSIVIVLDEVSSERENGHEDDTSSSKLMIVPVESVDKSSSTLSTGGDDHHVIEPELNLKECEHMTVPFGGNTGMSGGISEIAERNWPIVICGLEEFSKQKQLVYSRKRLKGRQEMKKISSASTPKRSKVSQVNKKVSPVSKPSSSALAVSHNVLVLDQIHKEFLSQRRPETKEFPLFTESPVDQNQHAYGLGDGSIEQLERPECLDPLHSSSPQELILMVDEEKLHHQKVLEKYSKQKNHTLQNATENVSLAIVAASNSVSKLQLDLPNSEIPARMTPVIVPDLLLIERERSSQPEANSIPHETGSMVCPMDKINGELETDGGILSSDVGPSDNMQIELEKQKNQATTDSPMSEQSLQNHGHKKEDQERQGCENDFILKNLEAPPVVTFVEENSPTSEQNFEEVKRKLRESPREKLEISKDYYVPVNPQNLEQKKKELKKDGWGRPQIQPKKGGRGRPRKCLEAGKEDPVALSNVHRHPQERLSGPTIDQHSKKDGLGGPQENLEANKEDEEASLNSLLEPQEESSELAMSRNSLEKVKLLEKGGLGRPQKLLESSPKHQFEVLKTKGRGRPRKPIEVAKENAASSPKLDIELRARPSGPATQLLSLAKGRKQKQDGRGRPRKKIEETNIEDPATSNNLYLEEIQQLKKDRRGRPRRQNQVNKEALAGLPDPMNVVQRLEGVPDQEKEWKVEVYEQSEIEVQMLNLSDGFHVAELEKSQSEVLGICETQLGVPLSDDDKQGSQPAQEQDELQHCPKHEINRGELEGQAGLCKMDGLGRPQKKKDETDNEDPAASNNMRLQEIKQLDKNGQGRPRKQKQVNKEDSAGLSKPLNVVTDLEEGLRDLEKKLTTKVREQLESEAQNPNLSDECCVLEPEKPQSEVLWICETQVVPPSDDDKHVYQLGQEHKELHQCHEHMLNQEEFIGEAGLPKKNGCGRPHKNKEESDSKDPAASKNLNLQEFKQLKKAGRGRPRKQKQVNREDSGGLSDPLDVVFELKEGLADQERELKGEVRKQSEIEAQKPNLSDGSRAEPEKSQSEALEICETVPLADDDKQGYQLAQEQEELQHCHEYKINQGKFEGQVGLSKIKSEKVIMSSKYPLRSRMNNQSHVPLYSKDQ